MLEKFSSSILHFGPWLTPYKIEINDDYVICSKNDGLTSLYMTSTKVSLKISHITNVTLIDNLFWYNILIQTSSGDRVILKHFSMYNAEQILELIHS